MRSVRPPSLRNSTLSRWQSVRPSLLHAHAYLLNRMVWGGVREPGLGHPHREGKAWLCLPRGSLGISEDCHVRPPGCLSCWGGHTRGLTVVLALWEGSSFVQIAPGHLTFKHPRNPSFTKASGCLQFHLLSVLVEHSLQVPEPSAKLPLPQFARCYYKRRCRGRLNLPVRIVTV